jgi:hypothetical protein
VNAVVALRNWIHQVKKTTNWRNSGFAKMIEKCDHILTTSIGKDALLSSVRENEDFALILLWYEADRKKYTPSRDRDFRNWNIPTHRLQFDHRGVFKKATTLLWVYEGGESKASFARGNALQCYEFTI